MFKILSSYINPTKNITLPKGCANIYRIYKNPKAKDLFIKAQKSDSVDERKKIFEEMGDFEIVVEKEKHFSKNRLIQFFKGLINFS